MKRKLLVLTTCIAFNISSSVNFGSAASLPATQDPTNEETRLFLKPQFLNTYECKDIDGKPLFHVDVCIRDGKFDFILSNFDNGAYKDWPGQQPGLDGLVVFLKSKYPELVTYTIGSILHKGGRS